MTSPSFPAATCRACDALLRHTFVDLGMSPLCETFLTADQINAMEPFYPLHVRVCEKCFLVQLQEYVSPESIFREYAYFSSYSRAWLDHARQYVESVVRRLKLDQTSFVVELASNDGYLLTNFVDRGIPVLGIEPAANVAQVAIDKGVPTRCAFFGRALAEELAAEGHTADLIIGNNVLAQVPDLKSFVDGMRRILKPDGVITLEFPHLLRLMDENQFDTIYHEHFSYFSLLTTDRLFARQGLRIFDVEELWTHGGSLRIYATHAGHPGHPPTSRLADLRDRESRAELANLRTYAGFEEKVRETKRKLLSFLIDVKRQGRSVAAYGAPGKGNTLLNYCGIRTDFVDYAVDRNPYKHGRFLPGTHIPVHPPDRLAETQPDFVLILPWNLKEEIMEQLHYVRDWGARFVVPIPEVRIYE